METRTYDELFGLVEALCGVSFASLETPRVKALINRRASKAYRASDYWGRYLVTGEERVVTSNLIPWAEDGLDTIDTFLRVHRTVPWQSASAQEFQFHVGVDGATLTAGSLDPSSAFVTYKGIHNATYGNGSGETSDVPKEWFEYMAHGAYADFLRSEGQAEKAVIADQEANEILQDELMKLDAHRGSDVVTRTWTYLGSQARE